MFNDEPNVTEDTRLRVLAAAPDGWVSPERRRAGPAHRTDEPDRRGVARHGALRSSLLVALERAAREVAYSLGIANSFEDDPAGLAGAVDSLLVQGVDAIILSEPVDDGGEPLVVDVPVLALGAAPVVHAPTVLSVRAAEGGDAAAEATRHLLALGHRTVHHIAGPRRWWAACERAQHWRDALVAAGAQVPEPAEGDWTAREGYRIGQVLARDADVTAIFAANDEMAIGAMHALHEAGRSVPGEVSVVGFDDIPVAAHTWPPPTTVSSDNAELATTGLTYLVDFLDSPDTPPAPPPEHVHQLVVRDSTAPAPAGRGTTARRARRQA